jgi:aromatic ring hydroxylase
LRTGEQYLKELDDQRVVSVQGELVAKVADHPALKGCARTIAKMYDTLRNDAAYTLMGVPPDERSVSLPYVVPRTADDLVRRRRLVEHMSRMTGGTMGRLPEYVPTILFGLLAQKDLLSRANPMWGENVERYLAHCAQGDLCLSHSFADRQLERSTPSQELRHLQIVGNDAESITVRGFKTMATLAPLSDECLVLTPPRAGLAPDQALFFAVPITQKGLHVVCRRPLAEMEGDHPLSARFDEMDAWLYFDDVRVPLDRVFLARDLETLHTVWRIVNVWAFHHILTRMTVKAELFLGVASWICRLLGTAAYESVRDDVGEIVRYLETLRAFVRAAEADAALRGGVAMPNPRPLIAGQMFAAEQHPRIVQILMLLGGQGPLMIPSVSDERGANRELVSRYLADSPAPVDERVAAFRLAWDLACSGFGARQLLFELFNARDVRRNRVVLMQSYDPTPHENLARVLAGLAPAPPARRDPRGAR